MEAAPIVPWIGGKRRLADQLLRLMPPHDCYVEAFAGGAALFFLRPVPAKCEVLNDANGELVNLYRVVQHHLEEFVRQFKWALSSRQVFDWLKATPPSTLTDIQRAARFFYLQHHAFGGKVVGQNYGTATTGPVVNLLRIEETLSAAHLRLVGAQIENTHWLECVRRFDRDYTLHYLDPPYWETEGYGLPWSFDEYVSIADFARSAKGRVMVSVNDHPAVRAVFEEFTIHEAEIAYSVGTAGTEARARAGEIIVTNWAPELLGGLF
jgi:DNA adenine methylase